MNGRVACVKMIDSGPAADISSDSMLIDARCMWRGISKAKGAACDGLLETYREINLVRTLWLALYSPAAGLEVTTTCSLGLEAHGVGRVERTIDPPRFAPFQHRRGEHATPFTSW